MVVVVLGNDGRFVVMVVRLVVVFVTVADFIPRSYIIPIVRDLVVVRALVLHLFIIAGDILTLGLALGRHGSNCCPWRRFLQKIVGLLTR